MLTTSTGLDKTDVVGYNVTDANWEVGYASDSNR